ncbi:MAG: metallophosphatase family protein [Chloroflexota bacterium]|nr:metallophosphatase family protein [Chloroflexota bacterium]
MHANLVALEAVLPSLEGLDDLWVMGDTVGYGPEPSAVLALLRGRRPRMVAGNHDRAVATGQDLHEFNGPAAAAVRLHREWLDADERAFLAGLRATDERSDFTLCHGSLVDPMWEYVFTPEAAWDSFKVATTKNWCSGHTHVPALFRRDGDLVEQVQVRPSVTYPLGPSAMVNPGSVGQPRDRDPRSSYAILDLDAGAVTFLRVAYDVKETQRRMRKLRLPGWLVDRLAAGR